MFLGRQHFLEIEIACSIQSSLQLNMMMMIAFKQLKL